MQGTRPSESVTAGFALVVGAQLMRENEFPTPLPPLGSADGIDGALLLDVGGQKLLDERYWDRLDGVVLRTILALRDCRAGRQQVAIFPDTRLELSFTSISDSEIELQVEEQLVRCPHSGLVAALEACARRLVSLSPPLHRTPALSELAALLEDRR